MDHPRAGQHYPRSLGEFQAWFGTRQCRAIATAALLSLVLGGRLLAADEPPAQTDPWSGLRFLVGDWIAEGGSGPGVGTGAFSFTWELGGGILVRRNRVMDAAPPGPAVREDLMVIYLAEGKPRAIWFDPEGRLIEYQVTTGPSGPIFETVGDRGGPRYRLAYERTAIGVSITAWVGATGTEPYHLFGSGSARQTAPLD